MVNLRISTVEQGIKSVLAKQITSKKWTWIREIKTYGGEFDEDLDVVIKIFPAIWVTFQGSSRPEKISHNKTVYPLRFVVMVAARSLRNEETQRHGTAQTIGTYDMLSNVQELLIGNDLSSEDIKGLAPLELGRTQTLFNTKSLTGKSISVLAQEFTTQYTITASDRDREEAEESNYLESVNINYYFDPKDYGIVENVGASDLVELRKD
ncbi:phage protein Gp37 [Acinetobacter bereziniae]|uniref:phage protein Gp37 n=1 Tax=Acinetobacter bereziniae TaxID=106648 RepID=UPI00300889DE